MARLATAADCGRSTGWVLLAETDEEHALTAFAQSGGELVLEGAIYPVQGEHVILPDHYAFEAAQRVHLAFERAARSHQRAQARREGFMVVDESG